MLHFKELKKGDAFKCLETCYIKVSEDGASNAIDLHTGHFITFVDNASVQPIQLTYTIPGLKPLDFIISRR